VWILPRSVVTLFSFGQIPVLMEIAQFAQRKSQERAEGAEGAEDC
jgi:hypothetical protein